MQGWQMPTISPHFLPPSEFNDRVDMVQMPIVTGINTMNKAMGVVGKQGYDLSSVEAL